jgi:hypothetical protein
MHTGGGERGRRVAPHVPPSNHIEKFGLKNAIKNKKRGTPLPPQIFSNFQVPPSKEFKNDCAFFFSIFFLHFNFQFKQIKHEGIDSQDKSRLQLILSHIVNSWYLHIKVK